PARAPWWRERGGRRDPATPRGARSRSQSWLLPLYQPSTTFAITCYAQTIDAHACILTACLLSHLPHWTRDRAGTRGSGEHWWCSAECCSSTDSTSPWSASLCPRSR